MSIEAIVVTLTLLVIVGLWAGTPLLSHAADSEASGTKRKQRERLLIHYERLLNNLRDLDEDFSTGKVAPQDYQTDRETLVQRGIHILAALDNLSGTAAKTSYQNAAAVDESVDKAIEDAVQAYRRKTGTYAK